MDTVGVVSLCKSWGLSQQQHFNFIRLKIATSTERNDSINNTSLKCSCFILLLNYYIADVLPRSWACRHSATSCLFPAQIILVFMSANAHNKLEEFMCTINKLNGCHSYLPLSNHLSAAENTYYLVSSTQSLFGLSRNTMEESIA